MCCPSREAVTALSKYRATKFDQTVDIVMRLGVDAAQADQIVRGSIVLPHGIGKQLRVVVFAKGAQADAAKAAATRWAKRIWLRRFSAVGWTSTPASRLPT